MFLAIGNRIVELKKSHLVLVFFGLLFVFSVIYVVKSDFGLKEGKELGIENPKPVEVIENEGSDEGQSLNQDNVPDNGEGTALTATSSTTTTTTVLEESNSSDNETEEPEVVENTNETTTSSSSTTTTTTTTSTQAPATTTTTSTTTTTVQQDPYAGIDAEDCSFGGAGREATLMPSGFYYCRGTEQRIIIEVDGQEKVCCVSG